MEIHVNMLEIDIQKKLMLLEKEVYFKFKKRIEERKIIVLSLLL